jgi:hypothetical protein
MRMQLCFYNLQFRLPEQIEVAEEVPQKDEYQHGRKTSAAKFFCSVSCSYAPQKLAHKWPRVGRSGNCCSIRACFLKL